MVLTTMQIDTEDKKVFDKYKLHPREAYHDVIPRVLALLPKEADSNVSNSERAITRSRIPGDGS